MRSWRVFVLNTLDFWSRMKERENECVNLKCKHHCSFQRKVPQETYSDASLSLLLRLLLTRTIEFRSYYRKIYSPMTFPNKSDYYPPTHLTSYWTFFSKFHISYHETWCFCSEEKHQKWYNRPMWVSEKEAWVGKMSSICVRKEKTSHDHTYTENKRPFRNTYAPFLLKQKYSS